MKQLGMTGARTSDLLGRRDRGVKRHIAHATSGTGEAIEASRTCSHGQNFIERDFSCNAKVSEVRGANGGKAIDKVRKKGNVEQSFSLPPNSTSQQRQRLLFPLIQSPDLQSTSHH